MIHEGLVADGELADFSGTNRLLSAVLVEGRTNRVRVFVPEGGSPPEGFSISTATLEDAYLVLMRCPDHEVPPPLARSRPEATGGQP